MGHFFRAQTRATVPEEGPEHLVQTTEIRLQNDVSNLNIRFTNTTDNFEAGKISQCIEAWTDITFDASILSYVRGYSIEFDELPHQICSLKPIQFIPKEMVLIDQEIKLLLDRKITERVKNSDEDEFISNIFIRP